MSPNVPNWVSPGVFHPYPLPGNASSPIVVTARRPDETLFSAPSPEAGRNWPFGPCGRQESVAAGTTLLRSTMHRIAWKAHGLLYSCHGIARNEHGFLCVRRLYHLPEHPYHLPEDTVGDRYNSDPARRDTFLVFLGPADRFQSNAVVASAPRVNGMVCALKGQDREARGRAAHPG